MQSILGNTRKPDIVFNANGRIDITARIANKLGLQSGDVIDIMLCTEDWMLYVKHHSPVFGRHEGMAFRTNSRGNNFRVWSKKLCAAMLEKCGVEDKVQLCVGQPVEIPIYGIALPIIIKYILK